MRHVVVVNMVLTQSFYSYLQHLDVICYPNGFVPVKMDELFGRALVFIFSIIIKALSFLDQCK